MEGQRIKKTGRPDRKAAQALGDHVIRIADALFTEKGYGVTSMALVASRARIGKDTLYRRYPDKATLFRDVVRRRIDDMLREIGEGDYERDPLRRLKSLGAAVLDKMLEPEFVKLQRIIIAEAASFPELGTAAKDRWGSGCTEICVKIIEQAQRVGSCRPGRPDIIARSFLWGLVGDPFYQALIGERPLVTKAERWDYLDDVWRFFIIGAGTGSAV
jgi:AcrR family transcriptional regulator